MAAPRALVALALLTVPFSIYLVYNEDPYAIGRFAVTGVAYLAALVLSIAWVSETRDRRSSALILSVSLLAVIGSAYALSGGAGYPATNVTNSTTYSCTTFTNQTNASGYPSQGSGSSCTGRFVPTEDVPLALGYNLLAWAPLVGCMLFSMPVWSGAGATKYDSLARLVGGSVPAAAILLNLVGVRTPGTLLTLPVLHVPLNPYLAYGMCDSITATGGCVYVNHLFVVVDYAFWLAIAVFASVAGNELVAHRLRKGGSIWKATAYSLALVSLLTVGLVVAPAALASGGVLVPSGSSFAFYSNNSFIRIPVVGGQNDTLGGTFKSSAAVDVYILNSTQFLSFDQAGGFCPVSLVTPLLVSVTHGSLAAEIGAGTYSLLFCAPFQPSSNIRVTITNAIVLSS